MSKFKNPALKCMSNVPHHTPIGIVIPVYDAWNNHNLDRAIYTIEQCVDLPYQLSLGVGKQCVAANRIKGEARLDPSIDWVLHMDDDVLVPPGFTSRLLSVLMQGTSKYGAVSAVMHGPARKAQNDLNPDDIPIGKVKTCLPPGTCFMYNRRVTPIKWDVGYGGSQWEDTDAMMQIKAEGYLTCANGNVQIMHMNNWFENKWWNENKARFFSKWGEECLS